jgi:diguanylate cyclase (GGDEF)-like protein/PAS domain S-box-containing protein
MNKRRFLYSVPIILMLIVVAAGWFATDYLGNQARQEIIKESRASALTLHIHIFDTLNNFEGAVKSLAGSPWIISALLSKGDQDIEHANRTLDRYNSAIKASVTYLMAADGMTTVASSNRKDPDSFLGKSYYFRPYFQAAAKGQPGRYFALGMTSGKRGFYASYPVRDRLGKMFGVVTMKKDLDEMETFFNQYPFCFLISPEGIIFLSSSPAMVLKSLWPLDKTAQEKLIASQQFGNKLSEAAFFKKEIADAMGVTFQGKDYFVSRKVIDSDRWSIVLLTPTDRIRGYKLIGILATIGVCLLIMFFSVVIYLTERSNAAIRQSEELYKALTDKSIAGIYVVQDGKFRFINFNAAFYAGYTREELLGQEASLLVSPEDMGKVKQNARAMLRGETSSPYEFRIITKQGETRWIMETVISILHEGRPAILGNSMNITESKQAEEVMRERDIQFKKLSSWVPGMIYQFTKRPDGTYCIPFTTEAIKDIFGCSPQDVREDFSPIARVILPEDFDKVIGSIEYSAKHLTIWTCEYRVQIPGQSIRWMLGHSTPEKLADGGITWYGFITDITESKQAEEALQRSETKFRTLYDSTSDAVMLLDKKGFISCNKPTLKMFGYATLEEFCSKHLADLSPNEQPDGADSMVLAQQMIVTAMEKGSLHFEWMHKRNDTGETFPADVLFTAMELDGKPVLQVVIRDITERKQAEEEIQQMAYHDTLTGLPNRKLFSDRLGIALAHAQRNKNKVGVAMLDLDKFKDVNDTLGHDVGDLLLKAAANRLSAALRKGDTVARFGGDEFVLSFPDLKEREDVIQVAQKIVESFRKPFLIGTHQLTVTTSIGIAIYPNDGTDEGILLKNADIAMYQAKQTGRDRYQLCKKS